MNSVSTVLVAFALLVFGTTTYAQSSKELLYGPFEGGGYMTAHGYQELKLSESRWYVAYHGSQNTSPEWVNIAWATRSAQLCATIGAKSFVQLRYSFEAVAQRDERMAKQEDGYVGVPFMQHVAGAPMYIPIFTPSGPRAIPPVLGPSKLAAVRCVSDSDVLDDPGRAISIQSSLEKAKQSGITP